MSEAERAIEPRQTPTDAGKPTVSSEESQRRRPLEVKGPMEARAPITRRRRLEKRARRIARNWRDRRRLLARDLSPQVIDALRVWAMAEARLELLDEQETPDRQLSAFQNSSARLLRSLEAALEKNERRSPAEELRRLMQEGGE